MSSDPARLADADFYIVTVPTPIDDAQPARSRRHAGGLEDRRWRAQAGRYRRLRNRRSIPARSRKTACRCWKQTSGLVGGRDFTVGYSPERINPGDKVHRFETITKVVSGQDAKTLDIVADVYGSVVTAGIHRAPSIKVAEAAKVIENTQRDLNIAFMNELSAIFHRARHRHRRRAGGGRHQMEFPQLPAGPGRRPLHRRRSLLPDLSRREGRLSPGDHPGRPAHQ